MNQTHENLSAAVAIELAKEPIHLDDSGSRAALVAGFSGDEASFVAYMAKHCRPESPGRLVMMETSPRSWPSWERHPEGDEVVIVVAGRGTFYQEIDGATRAVAVSAGSAIINPAGVWHTADVDEPIQAIYITPCPGTCHRPR